MEEFKVKDLMTENYRDDLIKLLEKNGLTAESLEITDDIPGGMGDERTSRVAKIQKKIFLRRVITPEDRSETLAALDKFDKKDLEDMKINDWLFLKNRLLHEIHHIVYRYKDEYECNKWAFYEMRKL